MPTYFLVKTIFTDSNFLKTRVFPHPANRGNVFFRKISPTPLLQRGEFLPFVKGGKEGFIISWPYNYGLTCK